ncbi:MAG: D-alanine--D-alanine ligase [Pseudomonadales bacterium]|nr:D-alanine--D-alanine ligase [Pseudomonadales bacterium]
MEQKIAGKDVTSLGRVAVLMGGDSAEREISLLSGGAVFNALQAAGVDVVAIDAADDLLGSLQRSNADRVFNMLHGRGGEDGKVQGLLELMGLPYTGSGVLASALSMDKLKTKLLWQSQSIPTPEFMLLNTGTDWESLIADMGEVVVKPVREGSSIGMSIACSAQELKIAYEQARAFDSEVMAEKRIKGAEFTVAILGGKTLPPIELKTSHVFYDFNAKYVADDTQYICPAALDESKLLLLQELSLQAFSALGCEGWGRVDVMQDEEGGFWLLEINTIPGMTSHSLVPMAGAAAGLNFEQLILEILTAKIN